MWAHVRLYFFLFTPADTANGASMSAGENGSTNAQ
jgi:hypothetical protein